MIRWQSLLNQVPLEAWTFVHANNTPYALFLSLRPDGRHWRGFVLANARNHADLLQVRWSADVLAEHFAQFSECELPQAQTRLVEILAQRLAIDVQSIQPARNGRPVQRRLTTAQIQQVAATQLRRRS